MSKSFWDLLIQGPLPQDQAIELGIQTAAALEDRPGGVGRLALEMLAFGEHEVELDLNASGAPTLFAPEVVQERIASDDKRAIQLADVWSLGIMLYMLLAGHSPFGGLTRSQQVRSIAQPRPTPDIRNVRRDISDDLAGLLYHMLQRNVEYRSRVPNVETVRRTLESIQREYKTPYSIPEFPIVEAKAILRDARQRHQAGKGVLIESEYQLIRRLVDTGELKIDAEDADLWQHSRWNALGRRLVARWVGSFLLGLSVPLANLVGNIVLGNPDATPTLLIGEALAGLVVMVLLNGISITLITFLSHFSRQAKAPWWVLPTAMSLLTGLLLVKFAIVDLTDLYETPFRAFLVGAAVGLIIGGVYTISMPQQRQDTILKQSRRPMIISGIVGLIYGVLFLVTEYHAEMTFYTLASALISVPLLIINLLMSFVLGVELGDRYVER